MCNRISDSKSYIGDCENSPVLIECEQLGNEKRRPKLEKEPCKTWKPKMKIRLSNLTTIST